MAQHDYSLEDEGGLAFLANLNEVMKAIVSNNSGPTEPNPAYAFQWWADTTAGIMKKRNAANNEWIEILDIATGRPVGAVSQTSETGAVLLSEGNNSQRPLAADIPAGKAAVRGNTQTVGHYFLELWNRATETWDALASQPWVKAITDALGLRITALENTTAFIYPNGGTAAAPANVVSNWRGTFDNPWPGCHITATVFLLINGEWAEAGWDGNSGNGTAAYGAKAGYAATNDKVVIQTAATAVSVASNLIGSMHGITSSTAVTSAPCYIIVEKKGKRNV